MSDESNEQVPQFTVAQKFFLRKLRQHSNGLPLQDWPRPTTWRRWMRKPKFVRAMQDLRAAFDAQRQLVLSASAMEAAIHIQAVLTGGNVEHSGYGITPHEIGLYDKELHRLTNIIWLERMHRGPSPADPKVAEETAKAQKLLEQSGDGEQGDLPAPEEPEDAAV